MNFLFECPFPCDHEVSVYTDNPDDAAVQLVTLGALRCRNVKYRCHCDNSQHDMSPISEVHLTQIVKTCMRPGESRPHAQQWADPTRGGGIFAVSI